MSLPRSLLAAACALAVTATLRAADPPADLVVINGKVLTVDDKFTVAQAFAVFQPPARYARTVVLWQLADWGLRLATIWFFLGAFGIEQSLRNVLLIQVTQSLATLIPATPGGIGTEQAFILYVFRGADIARSTLLALSVGMRLTITAVNVVIGFTAILLTLAPEFIE